MKILHVLNTRNLSGAENVAADICMMLSKEHEMIYCSPDGPIREALISRGVNYIPIEKMRVEALREVIQTVKPDLIDAHDVRATVATSLASGRTPFVSHLHVNSDDMKKITPKAFLYRLAGKKAKKIIAVSETAIDEYVFKKAIVKKTIVLKNIILPERLEMLIDQGEDYEFDFIFLGRLSPQKDPKRLAKVASYLLEEIPTATFGVIGEGELKDKMEAIFEAQKVLDQVIFTGNLKIPYKVISQAGAMLFCSRFEGTPISALEAMYFGVPIVSTPTDGLIDLIDHGINGYLSNDDEELSDYLVQIIENKSLRETLSKNQRKKFEKINDKEAYKKRIDEIYKEAVMV